MKENKLVELSIDFSVDIINLVKSLKEKRENIISNQIGRSGTSIGANIHEARDRYRYDSHRCRSGGQESSKIRNYAGGVL